MARLTRTRRPDISLQTRVPTVSTHQSVRHHSEQKEKQKPHVHVISVLSLTTVVSVTCSILQRFTESETITDVTR